MHHTLKSAPGSVHRKKRIARGNSGKGGTTAGRGTKGQNARAGKGKRRPGFEGGQVSLLARQPKLGGFKRPMKVVYEPLTLKALDRLEAGSYDVETLRAKRVLSTKKPVKLLGAGKIAKVYQLTVHAASKGATEAVTKAGGSVTIAK